MLFAENIEVLELLSCVKLIFHLKGLIARLHIEFYLLMVIEIYFQKFEISVKNNDDYNERKT